MHLMFPMMEDNYNFTGHAHHMASYCPMAVSCSTTSSYHVVVTRNYGCWLIHRRTQSAWVIQQVRQHFWKTWMDRWHFLLRPWPAVTPALCVLTSYYLKPILKHAYDISKKLQSNLTALCLKVCFNPKKQTEGDIHIAGDIRGWCESASPLWRRYFRSLSILTSNKPRIWIQGTAYAGLRNKDIRCWNNSAVQVPSLENKDR